MASGTIGLIGSIYSTWMVELPGASGAMVGPMDVVSFVEHDPRSSASGGASVGAEEGDGVSPTASRRDVIEGATPEVVRATSTTNTSVLLTRTSARSRPSPHLSDESEEVDGRVPGEAPPPDERRDRCVEFVELVTRHGSSNYPRPVPVT
jgi:hypothetical protein